MKKSLVVLMVLVLACSAMFASGNTEKSSSYKVQLITMDQMDQHWANVDKGCKIGRAHV